MFSLSAKLPINDEERLWVDEGFRRLEKMLGRSRLLNAKVILPDGECFPDPYDRTPATAELLFQRVCNYMCVDREDIEIEVFADETEELQGVMPYWKGDSKGCAGAYFHGDGDGLPLVAIRSTKLRDPILLVATVAHELGHVILIGGGHVDSATPDQEALTDLLTVFLGLGIFTANSAARFKQYQDERRKGWSMQRLGYLAEEIYGYALAKFAAERGDEASWSKHLSTNVQSYFKRSRKWIEQNKAK